MSKFEKYLAEAEENEYDVKHSSGMTSAQVDEVRKKEGIKFSPDAGHPTQRSNTTATYIKFYNSLPDELKKGQGLDYSAGLGVGSHALRSAGAKIESYEPFPHERATDITHKGLNSLPNKQYDYILNSAVLNVIEQDIRDHVVLDIWNHLKPEGCAIIGVRSKADVMGTKTALVLSQENSEILDRSRGSYQKGFTSGELKSYIQRLLPDAAIMMVSGMSQVVVKIFKDRDTSQDHKAAYVDAEKKKHPLLKHLGI
jgi:hypothetical protein